MKVSGYNKINFSWHPAKAVYYKAMDLAPGEALKLMSLYINEGGKYGPSAVAGFVGDDIEGYINLPSYFVPIVRAILADREAVDEIADGKALIIPRRYEKNGKEYATVDFA